MSLIQIQIPKRSKVCMEGQEPLECGMDYFSILLENVDKGYERQDFCAVCFAKFSSNNPDKSLAKYWKSKVPTKKANPVIPRTKDEQILALLKSSLEKQSLKDQETSFVLALYLARKRFMLLRKEIKQEDLTILQIYEIPETEEMIVVKKIKISNLQVEEIQLEIAKELKTYVT